MMLATPAAAERELLLAADEVKMSILGIDVDSIRMVDGKPRAWTFVILADNSELKTKPFYSQSLTEFDCKLQRSQVLTTKMFGEGGEKVMDFPPDPWIYPAPSTPQFWAMEYGCGKAVPADQVTGVSLPVMFANYLKALRAAHKIP